MFLNDEIISSNKERYLSLIDTIERENSRKEEFKNWLLSSDFFVAPASARYHLSCKGGLCQHCLNVYDNILKLCKEFGFQFEKDTLIICSLLHDLQKVNFYVEEFKNKKVYCESGKKQDGNGKFDWVSVPGYGYAQDKALFLYGNHEATSEYMARWFFPLTMEESVAILHHHMGMSNDCAQDNISGIMNRFSLALLLHIADMISCYITERIDE